MMKLVRKTGRKAKTLSQQQQDFTAEGSPPPGRVATSMPQDEASPTSPHGATSARAVPIKRAH